ncbi:MAG TPA: asparagine synthase (glutamine-hydrolyzing) [Burkholderiaceae bacterium]|nr:asparagine synthase (glutamine-hydrolyzing) [Burkholderiaceae bacterium]
MCGIVGALSFRNCAFEVLAPYIEKMRDAMAHRGPDGAGTWIAQDRRIGLGHRRLSIIDLSDAAAQPMSNAEGSIWISFNGEIYNHMQVRRELQATGLYRWTTDHSDTEVIIHAFEHWGIDCVERFRGMFAFALWDGRKRQLWLVRDRLGVKPLYYSVHHGRLTFASEIKALLRDPQQARSVDATALYHFLSFLTAPAPLTLFEGIYKLPPGTWMRVEESGEQLQRRYWEPWERVEPLREASEAELCERLMERLRDAVQLRKVSDVPVGVFLSGGIDSSTNTALFSEGESQPVHTFSIGYDAEYASYRSELGYARLMAARMRTDHHERLLSVDDLIEFLPQMVQLQDEPIADPVCFPVYYVSQLARNNGVTVCQVGEGADELFFGYPQWRTALRLQQANDWPVPRGVKHLALAAMRLARRDETLPYEWLRRGASELPVFWSGAEAFTETHKGRLLSEQWRRRTDVGSSWDVIEPLRRDFERLAWDTSHANWMTYVDLRLRLPELLLMRVDKMSMGVGLEARVPFLDHRVVEFALGIPTQRKLGNGNLKYLLKKAVRGLIPEEIIDRPKQGFGVPVAEWLLGQLGVRARAELDDFCKEAGILDQAAVRALWRTGSASQIWYLFNLALWWRVYVDGH